MSNDERRTNTILIVDLKHDMIPFFDVITDLSEQHFQTFTIPLARRPNYVNPFLTRFFRQVRQNNRK